MESTGKRTHLGLAEWNGTKDNNLVPHLRHAPLMIRDDDEQDPNRRYKSLYVWNSGEMCEMAGSGKYGVEYDLRGRILSCDSVHFARRDRSYATRCACNL